MNRIRIWHVLVAIIAFFALMVTIGWWFFAGVVYIAIGIVTSAKIFLVYPDEFLDWVVFTLGWPIFVCLELGWIKEND